MKVADPIIELISDNKESLMQYYTKISNDANEKYEYILNYPVVYIHIWKRNKKYEAYVGESNNFFQRTNQHYNLMNQNVVWQKYIKEKDSILIVIGHPSFNKSLTMDIENSLLHYLSSSRSFEKVYNSRTNAQYQYFTRQEFDAIFSKIWKKLRSINKDLFLYESEIKDSAIYKASPLHKLNPEQLKAKELILEHIFHSLVKSENQQFIFVQGDTGTGKTVLLSSMFYEMLSFVSEMKDALKLKDFDSAIIVNQKEQLIVYEEIVQKLNLTQNGERMVYKPIQFLNLFKKRTKLFDIVFIDEAHLLLTQNNQAFSGHNQLNEILKYSKVVVVIFDRKQILKAEQYVEKKALAEYIDLAKEQNNFIQLSEQMRMNVNPTVLNWLRKFIDELRIEPLAKDRGNYEIKIFDNPKELDLAIQRKAKNKETSLSRLIATYDWPYNQEYSPKNKKYWEVEIGSWSKPWNRELSRFYSKREKRTLDGLSWMEQPQTVFEVGSTYTIHGFDLNYAGVILGPSVQYRNGKVVFDIKKSSNSKAIQKRTLSDGTKQCFGETFLQNEINVLLTRGINGLYIYACDEELRNHLKRCVM